MRGRTRRVAEEDAEGGRGGRRVQNAEGDRALRIVRASGLRSAQLPQVPRRSIVIVDEETGLLYLGGTPLLVLDVLHSYRLVASVALGGVIRSGFVGPDAVHFVVQEEAPGGHGLVYVSVTLGHAPTVRHRVAVAPATAPTEARPMRPQSAAQDFVALFPLEGLPCVFTFAAGEARVAILRGNASGIAYRVAAHELQLDQVRDARALAHGDRPTTLWLAGAWQGRWQATALPLSLTAQAAPLRARIAAAVPECSAAAPCDAAGAFEVALDGAVFLVLVGADRLVVVALDAATHEVRRTAAVSRPPGGPWAGGLALDPLTNTLLLWQGLPGAVYKLRADSLALYETVPMGTPESPEVRACP